MSKLYIGTNTKMYKNIAQTASFLEELGRRTADLSREDMELFVIPSFTALDRVSGMARAARIRLGAQNMGWEDEGQFTGEISPPMLAEVGVDIAEIGHSERRHVLGETDEMENRKVRAALRHGMTALLCIGETAAQRTHGIADEVLRTQLKQGLFEVDAAQANRLWVAYEPVWAIGVGGEPASADYAEARHAVIRRTLCELFGAAGAQIPVLYGGSVNMENAASLAAQPDIGGLFIGRSAWDAARFDAIIRLVLPIFAAKQEAREQA